MARLVEIGVEVLGAEEVDLGREALRDMAVAHLRTTAPFLVSARPLSLEWRGRDLVSSIRSFSNRRATW